MSIEFEGLDEVLDYMPEPPYEGIENSIEKACLLVEAAAKQKAPKGAGELRRSISSRVEVDGNNYLGIVYTPLEYAPYVEFGTGIHAENGGRLDVPWNYQDDEGNWHSTSGMKPRPFLRTALEENREKILEILEGVLNE